MTNATTGPQPAKRVAIEGVGQLAGWGNGEECTFMGALGVSLRAMGENISYDQLMGRSGAAFRLQMASPTWDAKSCDAGIGFSCITKALDATGYSSSSYDTFDGDSRKKDQARQAICQNIQERRPVPVISMRLGMDWGVIAGYEDGGSHWLYRDYGRQDPEYQVGDLEPYIALVLARKAPMHTAREAAIDSVRTAVHVAGMRQFTDEKGQVYICGLAAYEAWISRLLDDAGFDQMEPAQLQKMIHPNAWCYETLLDARSAAARYLRSVAGDFDSSAAPHVLKAAEVYQQVAGVLRRSEHNAPFPSQLKEEPWTNEQRHAQAAALKEAYTLEQQAIAELEKALATLPAGIPPIPPLPFGQGRDSQFIAVLEATLAARGEPVAYDQLMGLSGAAFRVQFWLPEWCPSSEDLLQGYNHAVPVLKALGYDYQLLNTFGKPPEEYRGAVLQSLAAGRAVIMENLDGRGRYAVVVGQADNGQRWIGRCCGDAGGDYTTSTDQPWYVLLIGARGQAMEPSAAVRRSLEIAVELAHTKSYLRDQQPQASGFAAYEAWIKALRDESHFATADGQKNAYMAGTNAGLYETLADARAAAARYLTSHARDLGPASQEHLQKAADLYTQVAAQLAAGRSDVPNRKSLADGATWNSTMRQAQAAALEQVARTEQKAVVELEKALAASADPQQR